MGIRCGIVGLPNVGKSTLFNALTRNAVAAENYPFCTVDPNVGVVAVPDSRVDAIADIVGPERVIPATLEFVDIAGLVEGAARGEGLGNRFLAHVRETDAIVHVVRCFENPDVAHVAGDVDPVRDAGTVETELALADLEALGRALEKATRQAKTGDKEVRRRVELLERVHSALDRGEPLRSLHLSPDERKELREIHLLTTKPALYVANVEETGFRDNPWLRALEEHADRHDAGIVPVCASMEAELVNLDEPDRRELLGAMGLDEPGLDRVARTAYKLLDLVTFFTTTGGKEVRAWTVPAGTVARDAAGVIHTDFRKGFIRAEVVTCEDFLRYDGEHGAKEAGKWRLEGKDYVVREGDVIHFRTSA